jgi:hypothetical protein
MHQDELKAVWICKVCQMRFLFYSDIEDHKVKTGHLGVKKYDLQSGRLLKSIMYDEKL